MAWNIRTSKQIAADREILVHQVNVDVAASIVIDASTVEPDVNGDRILVAGTPMFKNSNNQYQRYTGSTPEQNVQRIVVDGTGGTYLLIHATNRTTALDFDADSSDVEAALEALASITGVEVTGTGTRADPFIVTFVDPDEASAITSDVTSLTGGARTVTVTRATPVVAGILARTERFPDGTSKSDLPSAIWNHGQWFRADRIVDWSTLSTDIKAALPTCKFS